MKVYLHLVALAICACLAVQGGCDKGRKEREEHDGGRAAPAAEATAYVERGDLDALRRHGRLRVLVPARSEAELLISPEMIG